MSERRDPFPTHRFGLVFALAIGLLVLSAPAATACTGYKMDAWMSFTLGTLGLSQIPPGTSLDAQQISGFSDGLLIIFSISGGEAAAESRWDARFRCVRANDRRFDTTPSRPGDLATGTYAAIAGVAIPNSVACPGDLLAIFIATPLFLPPQLLPACLSNLPSVVFQTLPTVELSDELGEGDEVTVTLFRLPFIIAYPVVYFVALVPSGSPITTPPLEFAANVCVPTLDAQGRVIIPCTALSF